MDHNTIKFSVPVDNSAEMKQILTEVYRSLTEKGYNPINQIVGYILSEDPTYITNHNSARSLICKIDRDELLQVLVKSYLELSAYRCKGLPCRSAAAPFSFAAQSPIFFLPRLR